MSDTTTNNLDTIINKVIDKMVRVAITDKREYVGKKHHIIYLLLFRQTVMCRQNKGCISYNILLK